MEGRMEAWMERGKRREGSCFSPPPLFNKMTMFEKRDASKQESRREGHRSGPSHGPRRRVAGDPLKCMLRRTDGQTSRIESAWQAVHDYPSAEIGRRPSSRARRLHDAKTIDFGRWRDGAV